MAKESSSEVRTYTFPFQSENITIKYVQRETHKLEGVGVTLWPASLALCRFLVNKYGREYFQNARILEVGAGVGLLGIALAKISAEVVITDADEKYAPGVLELLRENASNNLLLDSDQLRRCVQPLNWGEPFSDSIKPPYDIIVAADCIYHRNPQPLLETLQAMSGPDTKVYMAFQEHNTEAVEAFCDAAPEYFNCKEVSRKSLMRLVGEQYCRRDLHILRMRLKAPGDKVKKLHMEAVRLANLFDRSSAEEQSLSSSSDDDDNT